MSDIPFLDLGRLHSGMRSELDAAFDRVVSSSAFIGGPEVDAFERAFAEAHGRTHAIGCASGTDALALVLRALDIGAGDEVVVPSMTFFATAEAVIHAGAVPVIADVEPDTLLLGPSQVDAVRTERTRAVIPVHLYGHPVSFDVLRGWREQGLAVVEDAAQAHLATWKDEPVGSVGVAACFSFFPGKNLGALGDAGAVVTDDPELAGRVRKTRDHGRTEKYVHDEFGVSSRLDGLQAALLLAKLPHLAAWTAARVALAERYRDSLDAIPAVRAVPWEAGAVHHLFVVRVDAGRRDEIQRGLRDAGIASGVHYPVALSQQPPFVGQADCPVAEAAAAEVLSLPIDPHMTEQQVDRVCSRLAELT